MGCAKKVVPYMTQEVARKILCIVSIALFSVAVYGQANPLGDECSAYANVPLPEEASHAATSVTAPSCASYKSYRGIGRPVNYAAARTCAWQERLAEKANLGQNPKEPIASAVGGSTILADLYYNGAGVKKNVPLAFHLMCDLDENWGQLALDYLVKKKEPKDPHKRVEFCNYAFTTFSMNSVLPMKMRLTLTGEIASTRLCEQR